ncbi:hypothetical protein C7S18_19055 [Ahniella affigens]|uniref:Uncharacterized protein n=1 Tax=Ahniella affigens TaxID=2021234 RepID=A0A2P1PWB0_9GAMM|nr:hypothetical protein [Ahniella affigens]AVP99138.1 hypothetical protein C7S18_19055 [Ahniella affigens]
MNAKETKMSLNQIWKRVIAQGLCMSAFVLVIAMSAEAVPAEDAAMTLACETAVADALALQTPAVEVMMIPPPDVAVRIERKAAQGWRALLPGMKLPRT